MQKFLCFLAVITERGENLVFKKYCKVGIMSALILLRYRLLKWAGNGFATPVFLRMANFASGFCDEIAAKK